MPFEGNGFNYEAEFSEKLLLEGKKDNEIMPLDESLEIMSLLDQIRRTWGLRYPFEGHPDSPVRTAGRRYQNPHNRLLRIAKGTHNTTSVEQRICQLENHLSFRDEVVTGLSFKITNSRDSLLHSFLSCLEKKTSSPAYTFSENPPHSRKKSRRQKRKLPAASRKFRTPCSTKKERSAPQNQPPSLRSKDNNAPLPRRLRLSSNSGLQERGSVRRSYRHQRKTNSRLCFGTAPRFLAFEI